MIDLVNSPAIVADSANALFQEARSLQIAFNEVRSTYSRAVNALRQQVLRLALRLTAQSSANHWFFRGSYLPCKLK